ncbi:MAG TPA: AAA family ATPase [Tepidisphaeraceae bacterium]|jgi:capsular exopolysaccharide synthesis family protein|nr:AAA family ATPase [Tepidisphaeraceae bacterium]
MSQEIQLSSSGQGLPTPATPWGSSSSLGAPQQPQHTPIVKIHRLLRGRYAVALLLAAVFAGAGAAAGFFLPRPAMESTGLIEIKAVVPTINDYDKIMPMYQQYVSTVIAKIHSERVIKEAMRNPEWVARRPSSPDSVAEFSKNLAVKSMPNSTLIQVVYTDDHKDAKEICPIAVSSIIKTYQELYGNDDARDLDVRIDYWKRQGDLLAQQIRLKHTLIDQYLEGIGQNPQFVLEQQLQNYVAYERDIRQREQMLDEAEVELKQAQANTTKEPYSVEDLARVDPVMQAMIQVRTQEQMAVSQAGLSQGTLNPHYKALQNSVQLRDENIKSYANTLREKNFIKWRPDGTGGVLIPKDLTPQHLELTRMQEAHAKQKREIDEMSRRTAEVTALRADTAKLEEQAAAAVKKMEDFKTQKGIATTFSVIDPAGGAVVAADRRIAFTALGFLAGGGLPVCLMLLAGLLNPRYRYSDETTGEQTMGLTLLGILPDLPDRLSDPEQASIAAHCVHQIRTMLQINNGPDERRVVAVTSAAPGDGKTSLTLALGLSYAACGTRTLLIDCDLVGMGLTSRMNVSAPEGVLEAISHRSLLEYICTTDIADVSILPVGTGQTLHASTLSPAALRRLIEEAKKHFDTILVDTGPVLGSIEASLVAAAADAVVLAVSRGQQRPLVEKAVQHLQAIGAKLAGVVFNRAQANDFDRSISGLSLRSAAAGSGHQASTRIGPVARAVQSAFNPNGPEQD